jgi:hypothetical protein
MEPLVCPKMENCPIFVGSAFEGSNISEILKDMYKRSFCKAGVERYGSCKRFIAANQLGMPIPMNVMPNSERTVEEIAEMIKKQ